MKEQTNTEGWVWVVIYDQQSGGHYLGLHDDEHDIDFIPAFISKEAATDCYLNLPRERGKKYEVQAIHIDELTVDAEKNGFTVILLDADGTVVKQKEQPH